MFVRDDDNFEMCYLEKVILANHVKPLTLNPTCFCPRLNCLLPNIDPLELAQQEPENPFQAARS